MSSFYTTQSYLQSRFVCRHFCLSFRCHFEQIAFYECFEITKTLMNTDIYVKFFLINKWVLLARHERDTLCIIILILQISLSFCLSVYLLCNCSLYFSSTKTQSMHQQKIHRVWKMVLSHQAWAPYCPVKQQDASAAVASDEIHQEQRARRLASWSNTHSVLIYRMLIILLYKNNFK